MATSYMYIYLVYCIFCKIEVLEVEDENCYHSHRNVVMHLSGLPVIPQWVGKEQEEAWLSEGFSVNRIQQSGLAGDR